MELATFRPPDSYRNFGIEKQIYTDKFLRLCRLIIYNCLIYGQLYTTD